MGTELSFDIARTALLAMDCQTGIVSIYAKPPEEFLERAATVLLERKTAATRTPSKRCMRGECAPIVTDLLPSRTNLATCGRAGSSQRIPERRGWRARA